MTDNNKQVQELFDVGAHYGFKKTRRHPSVMPFLYGSKNGNDIIDLEKTALKLNEALEAIEKVSEAGKKMLIVGSKNEARAITKTAAERAEIPFVVGRWIGGTLTNFKEIRKRVQRLSDLREDNEKGNLNKYTKKERLLLNREMEKLEVMFGGIVEMQELPALVFVVDPEAERTVMREAKHLGIPVVALANTDCNLSDILYPLPANDTAQKSIEYFMEAVVDAYEKGKKKNPEDIKEGNDK